jgi:hypothetical protein
MSETRVQTPTGTYRIRTGTVGQSFGCAATVLFRPRNAPQNGRYTEVYSTQVRGLHLEDLAEAEALRWIEQHQAAADGET